MKQAGYTRICLHFSKTMSLALRVSPGVLQTCRFVFNAEASKEELSNRMCDVDFSILDAISRNRDAKRIPDFPASVSESCALS